MNDDRGELDLTKLIDDLEIRLAGMTKVLETTLEENSNLKVIIARLQEERKDK